MPQTDEYGHIKKYCPNCEEDTWQEEHEDCFKCLKCEAII